MIRMIFKFMFDFIDQLFNQNKKNEAAKLLLETAKWTVKLKQYQKGYPNNRTYPGTDILVTYCNVFARDFLEGTEYITTYNYDLDSIRQKNPTAIKEISKYTTDPVKILLHWTGIDVSYNNAIIAAKKGIIKEHTPESAQKRANEGIPIWIVSLKYGHEAIVISDETEFDPERGVHIAQAGGENGIMYINDMRCFSVFHKDPEIKYYEFPLKK